MFACIYFNRQVREWHGLSLCRLKYKFSSSPEINGCATLYKLSTPEFGKANPKHIVLLNKMHGFLGDAFVCEHHIASQIQLPLFIWGCKYVQQLASIHLHLRSPPSLFLLLELFCNAFPYQYQLNSSLQEKPPPLPPSAPPPSREAARSEENHLIDFYLHISAQDAGNFLKDQICRS